MKNSHYIIFTFTFLLLFIHIKPHVRNSGRSYENVNFEITSVSPANDLTSLGQLRLSLYESSALVNNETAADGVLILFDTNGNNDVDANDAPDITNLDENFSINNNGVLLSIESRAAPVDQEEIQLEVNTYRNTNYTIVGEGISMQDAVAFLYDNYTGASTEIPQNGTINYDYSIDSGIAESIASNRFKIIFVVETLSISNSDLDEILLYPNPIHLGKFYINIPLGMDDLNVSIYNILGSKLYSVSGYTGGSTINIDTDDMLSEGTYFVEFKSQGKTMVKKLVVN
ncbi:T9SS type A sorting domain-containing protein [Winogradskyella sp. MH6]|uniref:T9SS type A sorting domain-containing protein n=1 Tax=Winogradskyella sp. MH6 TaxID=2929510 RepID=UPI001FB47952|nr:T9SS type A sorting domain-containing protein [Winogradskyella sp. MH6]